MALYKLYYLLTYLYILSCLLAEVGESGWTVNMEEFCRCVDLLK